MISMLTVNPLTHMEKYITGYLIMRSCFWKTVHITVWKSFDVDLTPLPHTGSPAAATQQK